MKEQGRWREVRGKREEYESVVVEWAAVFFFCSSLFCFWASLCQYVYVCFHVCLEENMTAGRRHDIEKERRVF